MLGKCFCFILVLGFCALQEARADIVGPARVLDGDTLRIGAVTIRLHAIDAPETDQRCGAAGAQWACGIWAQRQAQRLFDGAHLRCEPLDTDRYKRVVGRCFFEDRDIGQILVQQGLAFAYRKYGWDYDLDEKAAAISGRGLHGSEIVPPAQYRAGLKADRVPVDQAPEGCAIKGNITREGALIFHVPGQDWYEATTIRPEKGERWFCSAEEAIRAGWRKALR